MTDQEIINHHMDAVCDSMRQEHEAGVNMRLVLVGYMQGIIASAAALSADGRASDNLDILMGEMVNLVKLAKDGIASGEVPA